MINNGWPFLSWFIFLCPPAPPKPPLQQSRYFQPMGHTKKGGGPFRDLRRFFYLTPWCLNFRA